MTSDKRPSSSGIPNFPQLEETVLDRWRREKIFEQALKQTEKGRHFVFFEGPPTANGRPGIHHVLARAFKDVIPRYKTMRGFFVERKAGWDTHGLPVELEVEKQLGLKSKKEIETYGIEKFNEECKKSVWKYKDEWEKLTERVGYWLDLEHPYITYDPNYVESLWWIIKQVWEKGFLYQGHKVVPHCPRCGTTLSSHEVAQGYKKVTEQSVYIKFALEDEPGTFILAWTTTPWTLPGNVALAIHPEKDYVCVNGYDNGKNEKWILEKNSWERLGKKWGYLGIHTKRLLAHVPVGGEDPKEPFKVIWKKKGKELKETKYKPLFPSAIPSSTPGYEKAFKVYAADFVTTEDGTGIVHTAVMYGEDDYQLGQEVGLPKVHTVNEDGTFNELVPQWKGWHVKHKDKPTEEKTTNAIIQNLDERGLLYKQEPYEHDYPFCWRCDSPLLYYAKNSWFIKMSSLREKLKASNATINWIPEHIKEGRFGGWLDEVKDWAFSRERYWGTPLPLWECEHCKERLVVGSMEDLETHAPPKTRFLLMRHGEAENNAIGVVSSQPEEKAYHLMDAGRRYVQKTAKKLKHEKIDSIIASPLLRTQETAEIVAKELGLEVITDDRVREIGFGNFSGKSGASMKASFPNQMARFTQGASGGGESWTELRLRMVAFLRDMRAKYAGKTLLIVTHGDPIWMAESAMKQLSNEASLGTSYPDEGDFRELDVKNLPYGSLGEIDLHRPYIDDIRLQCQKCKGTMRRVKELCDVWFDSGSMPFAQWHYLGEKGTEFDSHYPADYISEAIDQTRGWFYTLLAVATLLDFSAPYKNVVCLSHILDAKGQKMSKSRGNVVDPWEVIGEYGADPLRLLLFTMNRPGDYKLFDPKLVGEVVRKTFLILWNILSLWKLANPKTAGAAQAPERRHLLDQWALLRRQELVRHVTEGLDRYDVTDAGREIQSFITDLSTWYARRSRGRLKSSGQEHDDAVATLTLCLQTLARLLAPFTPMLADALYADVDGRKASIHLETWPDASALFPSEAKEDILSTMATTRNIVEIGHALREEAKIRVRQPLSQAVIVGAKLGDAFLEILREELNVRNVILAAATPTGVDWRQKKAGGLNIALDTTITDELMAEGWYREIVRCVNDLRKKARLSIGDRITIRYASEETRVQQVLDYYHDALLKETRADALQKTPSDEGFTTVKLGESELQVEVGKVNGEK